MKSRHGLSVLVMCGLVLGMMAISVSAAQGEQTGTWMIGKGEIAGTLKVEAKVEIEPLGEKKEVHLVLLTTSGANKVSILCKKANNVVGTVTSSTITGTLNIEECLTFINEKDTPGCDPINKPIKAGGTITNGLHKTKAGVLRKVAQALGTGTGGSFAHLTFNEETCVALSPLIPITGSLWIEDCNNEPEVEKVTHLIQEDTVTAAELGGLLFGGNKASIDGSANVSLADAEHLGKTFNSLNK